MFKWLHDKDKPVYTISIAAEILDCHPRTLRIYEEEGLIRPKRTKKKYRLYSQADIIAIQKITSLMEELSLNLSGIKALFKAADCFHVEVGKMIDEMLK